MSGYKAKGIVGVYLSHDGRGCVKGRLSFGIENTLSDSSHVGGYSVDSMCVYASQIGCYEAFGYD